jgi:hypothetical protein
MLCSDVWRGGGGRGYLQAVKVGLDPVLPTIAAKLFMLNKPENSAAVKHIRPDIRGYYYCLLTQIIISPAQFQENFK